MIDPFLSHLTLVYLLCATTLELNHFMGDPLPTVVVGGLETVNSVTVVMLCFRIVGLYVNGSFGI